MYQKAWIRQGKILVPSRRLWFISQPTSLGTYRTYYLHDLKRDLLFPVAMQDILTTTSASSQTYTSNVQWNNSLNYVAGIGGGGAGATGAGAGSGGGGGGGGAYNRISNFSFATPGTTTAPFFVQLGLLHTGTYPGTAPDTGFGNTVLASSNMLAKGGLSPSSSTASTGGSGGQASAGNPTTSPPGQNGGAAAAGVSNTAGGGGGGAGGPNGVGGGGSSTTGGTADGGTVAGGSPGNPGTSNSGTEFDATHGCGSGGGGSNASPGTGANGGLYGGGAGGGSRNTGTGGDGAQGILILSSVFPEFADMSLETAAQLLRTIEMVPYR